MFFRDLSDLEKAIEGILEVEGDDVKVTNAAELRGSLVDRLALNAAANDEPLVKARCQWLIRRAARAVGIEPASIHDLYIAVGRGEAKGGYTVPAINLRTLTYETARVIFREALRINAGSFIFEIAKSEMGYTMQRPAEYASQILAAAIRELWKGPVFIQADHAQINASNYKADPAKEKAGLKTLIREAMAAGFYNIDIDSSTLVDLSLPTLEEQQRENARVCADMTAFIRELEPRGVTVSVGGEIGEVGQKNSTPEEFHAFMKEYKEALSAYGSDLIGISKISIQTGTSHGGTVLPDGSIAEVAIDFDAMKAISEIARKEYGLGGAVQHGASTLPEEAFSKFVEATAIEVHLATAFQNLVYDCGAMPEDLKKRIYAWLDENCAGERKEGQTDEQFYYKTRKKGLGPFKREILTMPRENLERIIADFEKKFALIFEKLNIAGNLPETKNAVKIVRVPWDAVREEGKLEIGMNEQGE
ncbi:MAG: aldolase [Candidatus Hydrogenedentota bacterium]|nr:MAG: aldolase [Candidatus Hydrogenedentota bacterium]